ncbi:Serine--tRNA ligase [Candidatus Anstonella stagnisolia]|nr:Serine--tRNA ligase [Candidatus Anstonella stagnisolia]
MISIKLFRENPEALKDALQKRNADIAIVDKLLSLDADWRMLKAKADTFKAERNKHSLEISEGKKQKKDVSGIIAKMQEVSSKIKGFDEQVAFLEEQMNVILLTIPNIPHESVPVGPDEGGNLEAKKHGKPLKIPNALAHYEISEKFGIIDFERGAKVAGHRFVFLKGIAAKMERALVSFMIDEHTKRGYTEMYPPLLVNAKTMTGTGQLPKFAEELYKCERDELYLIPTSEVPVTNYFAGEIIAKEQLPVKFCAYTPCFRREAGSYQKDIKGIMRQHQFNKVELVKFAEPENSFEELEKMTEDAEHILEKLELPYRRMLLCTGDMGFAAAKTYDLEVWLPSQGKYREISSCSNCTDFQARRANIRYWKDGKPEFVHTLNGSGLAIGRTMIAVLENYQDENGVDIPKALQKYIGEKRLDYPK